MRTYYVPVVFYLEARNRVDAASKIAAYLDDAAASVIDARDICYVSVEDHNVDKCDDETIWRDATS